MPPVLNGSEASLPAAVQPITQTLAGTGRIIFDVTGMATLGVIVQGTAVMTCRTLSTSGDPATSTTSNRPWKSGASLGTNIFGFNSTNFGTVNTEWRVVGGRKYFMVECTNYTSGSLAFTVYAIPNSSIVYVGGGVQNEEDESVVAGTVFNAATAFQSVAAGSYLNFVFENPTTSGKIAIIKMRRFSCSAVSAFGGISTPSVASFDNQTGAAAPVSVSPSNLRTGTAAVPAITSVMLAKYNMSATPVDSSPTTANPAGDLLPANVPFVLDVPRVVPPGARFAHRIGGSGGGLAASATASIYVLWEEKDMY